MGFKDLLNKGKCLVGLHQGEWRARSADDCTFVRVCDLCHIESRRIEHVWLDWAFTAADSCDQKRVCSRCSTPESRVQHSWAPASYVADDRCEQHRVCSRCRATQPADAKHVMDGWRYTADGSCQQVQTCRRCGADGTKLKVDHTWEEWQHSNAHNGPVRVCRRCGELQAQPVLAAPAGAPQAAAAAGAGAAKSGEPSRKELFDALRGKMEALGEHTQTLDRVLGALANEVTERLAQSDKETPAKRAADERPRPPSFSDDEVEDLLKRAGASEEDETAAPERDTRLVGHWQYVETIVSGASSMSVQLDLILAEDGRFKRSSVSAGPAGVVPGTPEYGQWRNDGASLVLDYDDGQSSERRYELKPGGLFFPGSKWTRPWARVR